MTVWTGKTVEIATAHVAVGALLLATCVFVAARSYKLYTMPTTEAEFSLAPQGGRA
jgi:hypothetical protein